MSIHSERQVPSQEEVELIRWHRMICVCYNLVKGSIWWVKEEVWKRTNIRYDQHSTRKGHFGLSIRKAPPVTPYEMMPMLHGTSGTQGPVVARGLSANRPLDYPTSFGHLAPANLELDEYRHKNITPNEFKPKLNDREMENLDKWMKRQGLS